MPSWVQPLERDDKATFGALPPVVYMLPSNYGEEKSIVDENRVEPRQQTIVLRQDLSKFCHRRIPC